MTYSPEWNDVYASGKQMTRWPWSDLVSACKRHMPDLKDKRVLELGCGPGANSRFFKDELADYCGIESAELAGSYAQQFAHVAYPVDFTKSLHFDGPFDLICDRAAVTHNDTASIKRCLSLVHAALKPNGLFIGIDWFSTMHDDYRRGDAVDEYTRTNIPDGQFRGVGMVHFSDYAHIARLFRQFEIIDVEHKIVGRHGKNTIGTWNIVVRKV